MRRLAPPLRLIWDSHHTWRLGGESLKFTWEHLGPGLRHVHVKDSVDKPSARHPFTYVLPRGWPDAAGRTRHLVASRAV